MAAKRPQGVTIARLPEKIELTDAELAMIERVAKKYGLAPEIVIQVLAAVATDEARR